MTFVVWVPGRFRLTNQLLRDLRAAGQYEGYAKAKGWKPNAGHDDFADHQAAVRLAVAAQAKRQLGIGVGMAMMAGKLNLTFLVFGHHRHDPDAWCLLGKAAADGLTDARVIDSDRFEVWFTSGRVFQTSDEELAARLRLRGEAGTMPGNIGTPGLAIVLQSASDAGRCGHA